MKKFFLIFSGALIMFVAMAQDAKFRSVNNAEFAKLIANSGVQLIDVRTPKEYADGHIPNARNMDVKSKDFTKQILLLDKSKPVAVYCRTGVRSKVAAQILSSKKFNVIELNDGISAWNGEIIK